MPLKTEVKANWLVALRSGKYKQGMRALHSGTDPGDGYCCLGVLAEVLGCTWLKGNGFGLHHRLAPVFDGVDVRDKGSQFLSDNFLIEHAGGNFNQTKYAQMNDIENSFEEIANAIEVDPDV